MMRLSIPSIWVLMAGLFAACQSDLSGGLSGGGTCDGDVSSVSHNRPTPARAIDDQVPASAPFDISAVIRQVHLAFKPEGDVFVGGHDTFRAKINTNGAITLRAQRFEGEPSEDEPFGPAARSAPITFETASVMRGKNRVDGQALTPETRENGGLSISRANVRELLENREEGLEQSWEFGAAPAGQGDLIVRVSVNGMPYATETEHGLHFADEETGLGFRYGHATWIDARGKKTRSRRGGSTEPLP